MSNYVLAFRGQPDRTPAADEDQQWGAWFSGLGAAIADLGSRVGATRMVPSTSGSDPGTDVLTGYLVITADTLDAATALASGCPGLRHGVSVEVAEVVAA